MCVYKVSNHLFDYIAHSFDGPRWLHIGQSSLPSFPVDVSDAAIADLMVYYIPLAWGIYATGLAGESGKGVCHRGNNLRPSEQLIVCNCPNRMATEAFRKMG